MKDAHVLDLQTGVLVAVTAGSAGDKEEGEGKVTYIRSASEKKEAGLPINGSGAAGA